MKRVISIISLTNAQTLLYIFFSFLSGCTGNSVSALISPLSRSVQVGEESIIWIFTTEDIGSILGNAFGGVIFKYVIEREKSREKKEFPKSSTKRSGILFLLPSFDSLHIVFLITLFLRSSLLFSVPFISSFTFLLFIFLLKGMLRSISGIGVELSLALLWSSDEDNNNEEQSVKWLSIVFHIFHCVYSFGSFLFPLFISKLFKKYESGPDQIFLVFITCGSLFLFLQIPFLLIPSPIFKKKKKETEEETQKEKEEEEENNNRNNNNNNNEKIENRIGKSYLYNVICQFSAPKFLYSFESWFCIFCGFVLALNRGVRISSVIIYSVAMNGIANQIEISYITSSYWLGLLIGRISSIIIVCCVNDIVILSYSFIVILIGSISSFVFCRYSIFIVYIVMAVIGFHESPIVPSIYSLPNSFGINVNEKTYLVLRNLSSMSFIIKILINLLYRSKSDFLVASVVTFLQSICVLFILMLVFVPWFKFCCLGCKKFVAKRIRRRKNDSQFIVMENNDYKLQQTLYF